MKIEDYSKYYIQGSDHYLIPKDEFIELYNEMDNWKEETRIMQKQLNYLRSGEYLNQLKFERNILQDIVANRKVSKEDKEFIDCTHRNTELLEQQKEFIKYLDDGIKQNTPSLKWKHYNENGFKDYDVENPSCIEVQPTNKILNKILQKYKEIIGGKSE